MPKPFPKKLTPTSCTCKGAGTCRVCKAKKAKKMGAMPFGKGKK